VFRVFSFANTFAMSQLRFHGGLAETAAACGEPSTRPDNHPSITNAPTVRRFKKRGTRAGKARRAAAFC